jgi:hypothetical protein
MATSTPSPIAYWATKCKTETPGNAPALADLAEKKLMLG